MCEFVVILDLMSELIFMGNVPSVDGFPVLIKFFHNSIIKSDTAESALFKPSSGIQSINMGSKSM